MPPLHKHRLISSEQDLLAIPEDFEQLFANEMTKFLYLAMHLTADAERADTCVIFAMRDCFQERRLAKDRAPTFARRMVIRNAIRLVLGIEDKFISDVQMEFALQPSRLSRDALRDSVAIRSLPDLERVAFVICVMERYSILDCALILRKSPQEVHDAIVRATEQLAPMKEGENDHRSRSGIEGGFWDEGNKFDGSCGAILA